MFGGDSQSNNGARLVKFCMLTVTKMATVRNFEVVCEKFDVMRIHTDGNYAQI